MSLESSLHAKIEMSDFREDFPARKDRWTNNVWLILGIVAFLAFIFFGYSKSNQPLKMKNAISPDEISPQSISQKVTLVTFSTFFKCCKSDLLIFLDNR